MPARLWPEERDAELIRLYRLSPSLSASQIANELNCGITRNAVIGRIHRLGLALRGKRKAAPKVKKTRKRAPSVQLAPVFRVIDGIQVETELRCVEIEPRGISLTELELGDCRYPEGDGPFTFCGHPKTNGSSYCRPHSALVSNRPRNNSDAVTAARARRMRGINFRRQLLQAAE